MCEIIIDACMNLLSLNSNYKVYFVRRQSNIGFFFFFYRQSNKHEKQQRRIDDGITKIIIVIKLVTFL